MATFNELYTATTSLTGKALKFVQKIFSNSVSLAGGVFKFVNKTQGDAVSLGADPVKNINKELSASLGMTSTSGKSIQGLAGAGFSLSVGKVRKFIQKLKPNGFAAPIIESIANATYTTWGNQTWYYIPTVTTADTTMLLFIVAAGGRNFYPGGAPKFNGQNLTLAFEQAPGYDQQRVFIYYLLNPGASSSNFSFRSWDGSPYATSVSIISYKNTSGVPICSGNQTNTVNITPSTAAGDLVHAVHAQAYGSPMTVGAGQTELIQGPGDTSSRALTSRKFHNGNPTSMSITSSGSNNTITAVAEISGAAVTSIGVGLAGSDAGRQIFGIINAAISMSTQVGKDFVATIESGLSLTAEKARKFIHKLRAYIIAPPVIENTGTYFSDETSGSVPFYVPAVTTSETTMLVLVLARGFWEWQSQGQPRFEGQVMALAGSQSPSSGEHRVDIYYLLNPPVASGSIRLIANGYTPYPTAAAAISYKNTDGVPNVVGNQTISVNVSPISRACDIVHAAYTRLSSVVVGAGQTEIIQRGSGGYCGVTSRKFHDGTPTTMSIVSGGDYPITIAAEIEGLLVPIGVGLAGDAIKNIVKIPIVAGFSLGAGRWLTRIKELVLSISLSGAITKFYNTVKSATLSLSYEASRFINILISVPFYLAVGVTKFVGKLASATISLYDTAKARIVAMDLEVTLTLTRTMSTEIFATIDGAVFSMSASDNKLIRKLARPAMILTSATIKFIDKYLINASLTLGQATGTLVALLAEASFNIDSSLTKQIGITRNPVLSLGADVIKSIVKTAIAVTITLTRSTNRLISILLDGAGIGISVLAITAFKISNYFLNRPKVTSK